MRTFTTCTSAVLVRPITSGNLLQEVEYYTHTLQCNDWSLITKEWGGLAICTFYKRFYSIHMGPFLAHLHVIAHANRSARAVVASSTSPPIATYFTTYSLFLA